VKLKNGLPLTTAKQGPPRQKGVCVMDRTITNDVTSAQLRLEPGDLVDQTDDHGNVHRRTVKYAPWKLGDHTWVVGLHSVSGCYALCRCQPVLKPEVINAT
jgi:hypothetical protein